MPVESTDPTHSKDESALLGAEDGLITVLGDFLPCSTINAGPVGVIGNGIGKLGTGVGTLLVTAH